MAEKLLTVLRRPSSLDNSTLEFYQAYWESKRRGRRLPSRADIVPAEIKAYLPAMVLVDVDLSKNDFRCRLIGTHVANYILGDATSVALAQACARAGASQDLIAEVLGVLHAVCEEREPLLVLVGHGEWHGHFYPAHEGLLLPLSDDDKSVNMILIAYAFEKRALSAGRRRESGTTQRLQGMAVRHLGGMKG